MLPSMNMEHSSTGVCCVNRLTRNLLTSVMIYMGY